MKRSREQFKRLVIRSGMLTLIGVTMLLLGGIALKSCSKEKDSPLFNDRLQAVHQFEETLHNVLPEIRTLGNREYLGKVDQTAERNMRRALEPLVDRSRELLATYGISSRELESVFGSADDPRIALAGLVLTMAEKYGEDRHMASVMPLFGSLFQEPASLEEAPEWFECALRAAGIDAVIELLKGNVTQTIARKAIRKIASRSLGWLGAALAVYEFSNCMGWI